MPKRDKLDRAAMTRRRSIVAKNIGALRAARGLSLSELGELVDLPRLQVWRIEMGVVAKVAPETIGKFAKAFGVPVDSLYIKSRAA